MGVQLAQTIHAAGETSPGNLPDDTRAIALAARDECELLQMAERLADAGIPHKLIREPDPPFNGAATALGVCPVPRNRVRRVLSRLPLIR